MRTAGHTRRRPNVNDPKERHCLVVEADRKLENPILPSSPQTTFTTKIAAENWWQEPENRDEFWRTPTLNCHLLLCRNSHKWVGQPVPLRYKPAVIAKDEPTIFVYNTRVNQKQYLCKIQNHSTLAFASNTTLNETSHLSTNIVLLLQHAPPAFLFE